MWMKGTYKGLMSGIVYALKGDKVNVIRDDGDMCFVQNETTGEKFHVSNERLSNTYVLPDPAVEAEEMLPVKSAKKKQVTKSPQLF
jgi:hypothetical protein